MTLTTPTRTAASLWISLGWLVLCLILLAGLIALAWPQGAKPIGAAWFRVLDVKGKRVRVESFLPPAFALEYMGEGEHSLKARDAVRCKVEHLRYENGNFMLLECDGQRFGVTHVLFTLEGGR